jgi:NADH dehydrogenase/NADH:ubiquinone oxidoreductase subunit G
MYIHFKESEIARIVPKINSEINESLISDKARFSYDSLSTQRLQQIFIHKLNSYQMLFIEEFLQHLDFILFNTSKKILFLVDRDLDYKSLITLKFLSYILKYGCFQLI